MGRKVFLRFGLPVGLVAVLAVFLFLLIPTSVASAETYALGDELITITLSYGDLADYPVNQINGQDKYYKIIGYSASSTVGGATSSLVDGSHRVVALPGVYYMAAASNCKPSDADGNILAGDCSGILKVEVERKSLSVVIASASLGKTYGEVVTALAWDFKKESDRDASLEITFACDGFAAGASVGSYALTVDAVTRLGADCKSYYDVDVTVAETEEVARFSVARRELSFEYAEERLVPFNHYLLSDGVSAVSLSQSGVNGETVTAYFRAVNAPVVLTVGAAYEIEFYRYEVAPAVGEPISYDADAASNYLPTVTYTASTVRAKSGSVTVYQDANKVALRENDPAYLYLPISTFTYRYRDAVVRNYAVELLLEDVPFYENVTVTMRCGISAPEGSDVAVGAYPMTLNAYICDTIEDVIFEDVTLVVEKLNVGVYEDADEAETASGDTFVKRVTVRYEETDYEFELSADLRGRSVGDVFRYDALTSLTDPNLEITYASASLTLVKRSTGVSVVAERTSVPFGKAYSLAVAYLDHGGATERLLTDAISYRYHSVGSTVSFDGLPERVGAYIVTCTLVSDLYAAEPLEAELSVVKRPVAAYYHITNARKAYGETFAFVTNSTVQIRKLYDYDDVTESADRENEVSFPAGSFAGVILSSAGGEAGATVGEYPFDTSGIISQNYDVRLAIIYDLTAREEITVFRVVKAAVPPAPAPTVTVSGREIRVQSAGVLRAELSNREEMTNVTRAEGTDSLKFTKMIYGEEYYLRVRVVDDANYETADGVWCDPIRVIVPFAKPSVQVSSVTSETASFTADEMKNAVSGYKLFHRVGTGSWSEGIEIIGLKENTIYKISFRAQKGEVVGGTTEVSIRTLRAPVDKKKVKVSFDRETGDLTLESDLNGLEYRLLVPSGETAEVVEEWDWATEPSFSNVQPDAEYLLQVRYADTGELGAGEVTEIKIDTHKKRNPLALQGLLPEYFLLFVGGGILILLVITIACFAKKKRRLDKEGFGGKL